MEQDESLQAAEGDPELALHDERSLEELLVLGPFSRHELLHVHRRGRNSGLGVLFRLLVQSGRFVVQFAERAKRQYQIDRAHKAGIVLG